MSKHSFVVIATTCLLSLVVLKEDLEKLYRPNHNVLPRCTKCPSCGHSVTLNTESHGFLIPVTTRSHNALLPLIKYPGITTIIIVTVENYIIFYF